MPAPLQALSKLRGSFSRGDAATKLTLLKRLDRTRLTRARQVLELHEVLCFLRAYPDNAEVLAQVERLLDRFSRRSDLRRFADELADSGVDGTSIHYRFFWPIALWLKQRWPKLLHLVSGTPLEISDAGEFLERIEALPGDDFTHEALHDGIDAAYRLEPGGPSRTRAHHRIGPTVFQRSPLSRERPDLRRELERPPLRVRSVSSDEGQRLIDLACEAMVTRSRDLEVFGYGDRRDVRLVLDRDGLAFACIGFTPERRTMIRAAYGLLTLKNGVPIGYVQADSLFESAELSFNTFETFRGGESALIFARVCAAAKHLFGARGFSIEPYQVGRDNDEALESGAWWFYYKLGFRPGPGPQKFVVRELSRMKRDPSYRSSRATLETLSAHHLYFDLERAGQPIEADLGWLPAARRGPSENAALEAARRLGLRTWGRCTSGQKLAVERWSPILLALPLERWNAGERRLAAEVVKAKGGRRESHFVRLFDTHSPMRTAIAELVLPEASSSRVIL